MIKKVLKSKPFLFTIIFIFIIITLYIITTCLYLNKLSEKIIIEASDNKGIMQKNSKYKDIISKDDYWYLCFLLSKDNEWQRKYVNNLSKEYYEIDDVKTKIYFGKAKDICKYSYYIYDKNGELSYRVHNICNIYYKFKNGKWVVYDLYFYP
jgi:hypothetical protein